MAKDADGTSVQKLTEIHVNTFQKLIRVLSIKKNMKNSEKKKIDDEWLSHPHGQFGSVRTIPKGQTLIFFFSFFSFSFLWPCGVTEATPIFSLGVVEPPPM
jgi:hypothetical protein